MATITADIGWLSWWDYTPAGSGVNDYPQLHTTPGGTGTYADPITAGVGTSDGTAQGVPDWAPGTRIYVPELRRYFIVETFSSFAFTGGFDLWIDGRNSTQTQAENCASSFTGSHTVITAPATNYVVVPGVISGSAGACSLTYGETATTTGGTGFTAGPADTAGIRDTARPTAITHTTRGTDRAGLSDTVSAAFNPPAAQTRAAAEAEGLSDAGLGADYADTITDKAGVSETVSPLFAGANQTIAGPVLLTDTATPTSTYLRTVTDPTGLSDSSAAFDAVTGNQVLTDGAGLGDVASAVVLTGTANLRTIDDPAGLRDAAARTLGAAPDSPIPLTPYGRNATGLRGANQLLVRIGRGVAARTVTVPLPDDSEITWSAPGGDDTFSCTIDWPDRGIARPDAFTQNMPLRVEDRRTGEVIWQGRVADPGFSGDRAQQQFRIAAVGSGHDLDMISTVKLYVDRDPDHWYDLHTWPSGALNKGDGTGFIPSVHDSLQIPSDYYLEFPWPSNTFQATGAIQRMAYLTGLYAAQDMFIADGSAVSQGPAGPVPEVHGLRFSWMTSFANSNSLDVLAGSADPGTTTVLYSTAWTTGGQHDVSTRDGIDTWSREDYTFFYLGQTRTGGNITSSGGDGYIRFANIHVLGKRYNRYGVDVTGVRIEALAPYEIVEDMLGSVLDGRIDPGTIVPDGATLIDQAAWWEPTSVSEILDAANAWNSDAWWGVWAPANPDGLPRLDYRSWNVSPRYTLDDTATVQLAGGAEDWANSALITFLRGNGVPSVTRATLTVPAISRIFGSRGVGVAATRTRDLSIDLTDRGGMSRAKAVQLAGQMLAASATDRASGSTVIRTPIMDDATGRLVQPWEIRPGWPVLVGSTPNQFTSGSPVRFDGESTFRLSKVTYRAGDDASTLEFDGGARRLFKGGRPSGPQYSYVKWANRQRQRRR